MFRTPTLCRSVLITAAFGLILFFISPSAGQRYVSGIVWPEPPVITPGENNGPPSDAVILFNGKGFDAWQDGDKFTADDDGAFTARAFMRTKQGFGDCQLHLEFATPREVKGTGQGRGNNGVGFMNAQYEVQILDSYENKTYFEGQCASVYNQRPPMVNACRKPGEWQTFDIVFTAPRFADDGRLLKPAYMTVFHNGVLVQNHTELQGNTFFDQPPKYTKHPDKLPLVLMYHGNPVRFRNIWLREFKELEPQREEKKP